MTWSSGPQLWATNAGTFTSAFGGGFRCALDRRRR